MTGAWQMHWLTIPALAAAAAAATAGCRASEPLDQERLLVHSASTASTPTEPQPQLSGNRLGSPFTYEDGKIRFDPPPAAYIPAASADEAQRAFDDTRLYADQTTGKSEQRFLAAFTSYQQASAADADGTIISDGPPVAVWVLRYQDVIDTPAGPGGTGVTMSAAHDLIAIVNASTGTVEEVISAPADRTAAPAPRAGPNAKPTS